MIKLLTILLIGLVFESIGVVLLSRGLIEIIWLFSWPELNEVGLLADKLVKHSDPVSNLLWEGFPSTERSALLDGNGPEKTRKLALLRGLNSIVQGPALYSRERFAGVPLSNSTQQLLASNPKGNDLIRLNRLLIEDAYPLELAKCEARKTNLSQIVRLVGRGLSNSHVLSGVFFEALFFVALLMLMSRAEVSFVWPLTSLSFVVTTIAAKIYLHEEVSAMRWSGVCLIMLGAGLISWTEKAKESKSHQAVPVQSARANTLPL